MGDIGFICPICGKYYFQDFDGLEECSVCNWINNIVQYDDHDFSEGSNALSVNEYRIEYAVLNNIKTKDEAEELKEEFRSERNRMHEEFRESKKENNIISCEEMTQLFVTARLKYMEKLSQILQRC